MLPAAAHPKGGAMHLLAERGVALVWAIPGALILGYVVYRIVRIVRTRTRGVRTRGTVVELTDRSEPSWTSGSSNSSSTRYPTYTPAIRFRIADGRTSTAKAPERVHRGWSGLTEGDEVTLWYRPDKPTVIELKGPVLSGGCSMVIAAFVGAVFLAFGLVILFA